jgi:hypothetical protein
MKRVHLTLIVILLAATVGASAVPRADLPQTTFNESDAPVNLAPPCRPSFRLAPPDVDPITVLPPLPTGSLASPESNLVAPAAAPHRQFPRSLQALLCTFLV